MHLPDPFPPVDTIAPILANELGKLGGFGARWVGSLLPNSVYLLEADIDAPPAQVHQLCAQVLSESGYLLALPATAPGFTMSGVVGGGAMNRAVVTLHIADPAARPVKLRLRGVAKEGLIKQHSAQYAVEWVLERIQELCNVLY